MKIEKYPVTIGATLVTVLHHLQGKSSPIKFIRVHGDELAARDTALNWLEQFGGEFIDIENKIREVRFEIDGCMHAVDPNRIFALDGILASLEEQGSAATLQLAQAVMPLPQRITSLLQEANTVVALHNNQDFNIHYYQDGGECFGTAKAVSQVKDMHPHDFILVNREQDYESLVAFNINVVLLNAEVADHPGSLSDYCTTAGMRYINIEAKQNHLAEQTAMLGAVMKI